MKNILTTIFIVLGLSSGSYAQQITHGLKAGLNVSDWRGDAAQSITDLIDLSGVVGTSHNVGFHAGGFLVIPVTRKFYLEPALIYSQKGMELTENLQDMILPVQAKASIKSHYIELPIMAKVQLAEGLQLFAGPQVSYLASNRLNAKAGVLGFNVKESFKIDAGFRKVDVALSGGLGYQFANGMNLSAAYEHGLSTIDEGGFFNAYNRAFKASVGFVF